MQSHMLSVHKSYTMDDTGYINLINCLESMTPFEAIRQAEEINKVNGFEVVSKVAIRSWKRKMKNQILKNEISKIKNVNIEISKIEILKIENRKLHKENENGKDKMKHLQKGYMKMLN